MTDPWAFDPNVNDLGQNQDNSNTGLRSWAEAQKKQNDELRTQLADVLARQKAYELSSVFEDLGVPKSAAKLYKGDTDPEAIKSWVTEVKTAFGVGSPDPTATDALPEGTPPNPAALTPGQENLYRQLTAAGEAGRPSTGIEDLQRGVNQAGSVADLIANMANLR